MKLLSHKTLLALAALSLVSCNSVPTLNMVPANAKLPAGTAPVTQPVNMPSVAPIAAGEDPFFPMAAGKKWNYNIVVSVGEMKSPATQMAWEILSASGGKYQMRFTTTANGQSAATDAELPVDAQGRPITPDGVIPYSASDFQVGQTWDENGMTTRVISTDEVIKTPAGQFTTVKTVSEGPGASKTSWLAKGVGLIKSQTEMQGITTTMELLSHL